jgi:hypothetical protein
MGADPRAGNAVVDAALRVFGVRGLRIADASVIPVIPGPRLLLSLLYSLCWLPCFCRHAHAAFRSAGAGLAAVSAGCEVHAGAREFHLAEA